LIRTDFGEFMHPFYDFYLTLNIKPNASSDQVEIAFQIALRNHADMKILEKLRAAALGRGACDLRLAYETLIDPVTRARYDTWELSDPHTLSSVVPQW
jgi:DnaJ-class molecular chaperone